MKGRRTIALGAMLVLLAVSLLPQAAMAGPKRRIAVLPFEYGAVSGHWADTTLVKVLPVF
jgi:hypothetical protein